MEVPKNAADKDLRIKIACRMDKPLNMKHCGYKAYSLFYVVNVNMRNASLLLRKSFQQLII